MMTSPHRRNWGPLLTMLIMIWAPYETAKNQGMWGPYNLQIVDTLALPDSLPPGDYVLGWRSFSALTASSTSASTSSWTSSWSAFSLIINEDLQVGLRGVVSDLGELLRRQNQTKNLRLSEKDFIIWRTENKYSSHFWGPYIAFDDSISVCGKEFVFFRCETFILEIWI